MEENSRLMKHSPREWEELVEVKEDMVVEVDTAAEEEDTAVVDTEAEVEDMAAEAEVRLKSFVIEYLDSCFLHVQISALFYLFSYTRLWRPWWRRRI